MQCNSNAINKFEKKKSGKVAARAVKGFTLFILNNNMDDIMKIVKPLEDSGVFIDGVTEAVKHEIKKQECGFPDTLLAPLAASVVQSVIFPMVKGITGRGVMTAGRGYYNNMDKNFKFRSIL